MRHEVFNSATFNFLTVKSEGTDIIVTGETKEGLESQDEIQNPYNGKQFLPVKRIIERRDSRDYPVGNGYFYKVAI